MDGSVTQSGVAATAAPNPLEAIGAFFSRFMKRDLDVDVEQCIVDAENLDEINACKQ
tara:strand:- start:799 stop:969 length:171 start_codon:yes stop_codon:yes gene_type:complete